MKLKAKILSLSLIPVILLGVSMFLVAADRIANGIYDEAYLGMHATTLAVRDIFEIGYEGAYRLDEKGDLWKGEELNISQSIDIVDHIKENTGLDVTIFWNDTRVLTSITDENGNRQVGTKASEEVAQSVLAEGNSYQNRHVEILGKEYVVYYAPFYQDGTEDVAGMIFLGTPQDSVSQIINRVRLQLFVMILLGVLLSVVIVYCMVNRIVLLLDKNMELLGVMSDGNLDIAVEGNILKRKDEIGELGRSIESLKHKLGQIIHGIRSKSDDVFGESDVLKGTTEAVYQVMREVDSAVHNIAGSCNNQTEEAVQTSHNVSEMGEMIGHNGAEMAKMNDISSGIMKLSEEALIHFDKLNKMMVNVREAIRFLSEQTSLTSDSVLKISSATEIITAIASQTNLLSLNASIEAARAGEHGNGFAVVAAEIQELSRQSNTAAEEIQEIVATLNIHSSHALERMEETRDAVEKQERDIVETSNKVRDVNKGIAEMASGMEYIMQESEKLEKVRMNTISIVQSSAAASEENLASVEEILADIEKVYEDIEDISGKAKRLNTYSQDMKEKLEVFSL
ncbi:MAG: methyl-accepting chemotaxis protein [Lachnospiraceae bacterium]|nr:methyl-accepting chemotaxis protein [Lachnospiraceae bacterium]